MDERLLRSFVTAAEMGSVTLASERLNLTQPALSRQIQRLEQELGLALFERGSRALRLSAEGDQLLSEAQAVLVAIQRLCTKAHQLQRGETGVLRVGACSQVIERYMSDILPAWYAENPNIEIRLEEGGGSDLAQRLTNDELHLTINARHFATPDRFDRIDIGAMRICAFGQPELFGTQRDAIELVELSRHPLLLLNRRHFTRVTLDSALRSENCLVAPTLESGSPHTLFAIAQSSGGVAVAPHPGQDVPEGLVAMTILHRGAPLSLEMSAIWPRSQPLARYGHRFVSHLRDHLMLAEMD